jgi:hypothetical protein
MARDFYETTIALPDAATLHVVALAGVKASVVPRGASDVAGSLVDIFVADTGVTKRTNPILTTSNGTVRFWADGPAEYDIVYEDTIVPARVTDRVGWNSVPAKALPTSALVADAGITQAHLSAAVVNNEVPIGGVIEWWRPNVAVPVPTGFVICDGKTTLAIGQHDFPWNSAVTVPDLRNLFILGADNTKADAAGASGTFSDLATDAPGIRGAGGSNANSLVLNQMPSHDHGGITGLRNAAHAHAVAGALFVGDVNTNYAIPPGSMAGDGWRYGGVQGTGTGTEDTDHRHAVSYAGGTSNGSAGANHNNAPKWVGLLRIMKVKR